MKKISCLISILVLFMTTLLCAFAGDVPESLLFEDGAKVFIGTVENFTFENADGYSQANIESIDVIPTQKIKGDVEIGIKETYTRCDSILTPETGKEYLFCYVDENNFYIYDIESRDENSIVLVDSDKYDMTKRLENYLNEGAFFRAEQERESVGKQISFLEYLYNNSTTENLEIEKVTFRYQNELHEVDKDDFLRIANEIIITGAKDDILFEAKSDSKAPAPYETVLYIELLDENDRVINFAAVSRFGEVDRYALFMSRLMMKDYLMKSEDLSSLYSLFPEEVKNKLYSPENLPIQSQTLPLKLPDEPIIYRESTNYYNYLITGAVALLIIIAFAVILRARNKKQK